MQPPKPLLGQTISHYRIVEKQGRGGMRSVNKSEDTRLDRSILVVHAVAPNAAAIITPNPQMAFRRASTFAIGL